MRVLFGRAFVCMFLVCLLLLFSGCNFGSKNMQRAGLRSASDVGVTAYLDQRKTEDVPACKARVKDGLDKVTALVDSGIMSLGALTNKLAAVFPDKMQGIASSVLNAIDGTQLPVDKIGENNKARIRAVINGGYTALSEYRVADRQNDEATPMTP